MYSKQEASQLRKDFWTAFGMYMAPVHSAEGETINWINYKTGEKNIYFRLQATNKKAFVAIELAHPDIEIQQIYFEHFESLKKIFNNTVSDEWIWSLHMADDDVGKIISRIYTEIDGVSVFKREDWPQLISFFKTNIILLDEFWSQVKYGFEALR